MAAHARGIHDVGGLEAGPIDRGERENAFWEQRADALMRVLGTFDNPEHLAYGRGDDPKTLYRVRFQSTRVLESRSPERHDRHRDLRALAGADMSGDHGHRYHPEHHLPSSYHEKLTAAVLVPVRSTLLPALKDAMRAASKAARPPTSASLNCVAGSESAPTDRVPTLGVRLRSS